MGNQSIRWCLHVQNQRVRNFRNFRVRTHLRTVDKCSIVGKPNIGRVGADVEFCAWVEILFGSRHRRRDPLHTAPDHKKHNYRLMVSHCK